MRITALDLQGEEQASVAQSETPEGVEVEELMQGLRMWTNPINRFTIFALHRSADPLKRTKAWEEKTRAGLSTGDWLREYELVWEALNGRPVYADEWSSAFHVAKQPLGWNPKIVVARGWDFGLYPATVFAQLLPHSRLIILRECVGEDIDTERFIYEVDRLSNDWFPGATFAEFIDPTGRNRAGTDGRAYTRLLTAKPLRAKRIILGANAPAARRTAVIDFLKDNVKGLPCLLVDPSCVTLIKGFNGGYLYAFHNGTLKPKPEKNLWSHIHDGLQYLCSKIRTVKLTLDGTKLQVTEPRFGTGLPLTPTGIPQNLPISTSYNR